MVASYGFKVAFQSHRTSGHTRHKNAELAHKHLVHKFVACTHTQTFTQPYEYLMLYVFSTLGI